MVGEGGEPGTRWKVEWRAVSVYGGCGCSWSSGCVPGGRLGSVLNNRDTLSQSMR